MKNLIGNIWRSATQLLLLLVSIGSVSAAERKSSTLDLSKLKSVVSKLEKKSVRTPADKKELYDAFNKVYSPKGPKFGQRATRVNQTYALAELKKLGYTPEDLADEVRKDGKASPEDIFEESTSIFDEPEGYFKKEGDELVRTYKPTKTLSPIERVQVQYGSLFHRAKDADPATFDLESALKEIQPDLDAIESLKERKADHAEFVKLQDVLKRFIAARKNLHQQITKDRPTPVPPLSISAMIRNDDPDAAYSLAKKMNKYINDLHYLTQELGRRPIDVKALEGLKQHKSLTSSVLSDIDKEAILRAIEKQVPGGGVRGPWLVQLKKAFIQLYPGSKAEIEKWSGNPKSDVVSFSLDMLPKAKNKDAFIRALSDAVNSPENLQSIADHLDAMVAIRSPAKSVRDAIEPVYLSSFDAIKENIEKKAPSSTEAPATSSRAALESLIESHLDNYNFAAKAKDTLALWVSAAKDLANDYGSGKPVLKATLADKIKEAEAALVKLGAPKPEAPKPAPEKAPEKVPAPRPSGGGAVKYTVAEINKLADDLDEYAINGGDAAIVGRANDTLAVYEKQDDKVAGVVNRLKESIKGVA